MRYSKRECIQEIQLWEEAAENNFDELINDQVVTCIFKGKRHITPDGVFEHVANVVDFKPPQRFSLGYLQAIYEDAFKNGMPRAKHSEGVDPGDIGTQMMIKAFIGMAAPENPV